MADIDESPHSDEEAEYYVERMAIAKGAAVRERLADDPRPVLSADTTLECDGQIIGKPRDQADFHRMMETLSGRSHSVLTAVALHRTALVDSGVVRSEVTLRRLEPDEVDRYWQSGEPLDKAGGYAVQGLGGQLVTHLNGSYSAVVGLPLDLTARLLNRAGIETLPRLERR